MSLDNRLIRLEARAKPDPHIPLTDDQRVELIQELLPGADPDNPRIKAVRSLLAKAKARMKR